jgi:signal transduction histidine kinase
LILASFALVPAIVLTLAWGGVVARVLPLMSGSAAWDSVAASGTKALEVARRQPRTVEDERLLATHEQELAGSVTQARRFGFLAKAAVPALLFGGLMLLALLSYLTSRVAGHLSRQLSRPLQELVGWTERIRHGEPLPERPEGRGAPEFAMLREGMRQMAVDLEMGRRSAVEAERLAAFRESASQVAHELKNPLTPIRFAVERLKRGVPEELRDAVDVLATESARLEAMAKSFAQFGRLPEGPPSDVDVGDLVRSVVRTAVSGSMSSDVEVSPDVPLLHVQHDALHRAMTNVLLNAVEACDGRGGLLVRVEVAGNGDVVISCRDTGSGIPPERLATIWNPYVTHKTGGTGLGLAIVKQTVLANGGRVEAESTVGTGTEIRLIFPRRTTTRPERG